MVAPSDHCFVVPAYGQSPYLDACLQSLAAQDTRTRVVIATSTPNAHIAAIAAAYGFPVRINPCRGGIGSDWNFALETADAPWVTLAHQDDVYLPSFISHTLRAVSRHPDAILAFTRYREIEGETLRGSSLLLAIKHALLELGFAGQSRAGTKLSKTNVLRFGCAIPCPAVTINLAASRLSFRTDLEVDLDWAAWLELARAPGSFVYVREPLLHRRVHEGSETSAAINGGRREAEDQALLRTLWPPAVARAITTTYRIAYRSNKVLTRP